MNRMYVLAAAVFVAAAPAAFAQTAISAKGTSFPIVISQPGSYRLAGNLAVPAGTAGIVVNASNVTIDLNGYTVSGPVKCAGQGSCNATSTSSHGVEFLFPNGVLRNGNVTGFAGSGVYASAAATLEDLTVTQNTDHGVYGGSALQGTLVRRVKARQNGLTGFSLWGATLTECIASQNGQHGFSVTSSTLIDGMAAYNIGTGVYAAGMVMLRGVRAASNSSGNFGGNYSSAGGNMNEWTLF